MSLSLSLRDAVEILARSGGRRAGVVTRELGPLRWTHYDVPAWWESDYFGVVDVPAAEVIRLVQSCRPGPHLIGVATTDPEAVIAPYAALGYKTVPSEPLETIMARSLEGFAGSEERYPVQLVQTEEQRQLYNTMISPEDGHGQMQPEELADPSLQHYFVELDGLCVSYAKVIQATPAAVVVEPLGTREGYRRRGIATAVMNRLHADAASQAARWCVIDASAMGVLLYRSLGYQIVGYKQKFVPQDWERPH